MNDTSSSRTGTNIIIDNHHNRTFWDMGATDGYSLSQATIEYGTGHLMEKPGQWSFIQPMPRIRHSMVWTDKDGSLIVFGGWVAYGSVMNDTWIYYPSNETWKRVKDGPTLYAHTAIWDVTDQEMLVFGGSDGKKNSNKVWAYTLTSDTWLEKSANGPSMSNHSAVWDSNDNLMVVYGYANSQYDVWTYEPSSGLWSQKNTNGPSIRNQASAWDPENKTMYIFGGRTFVSPFASKALYKYNLTTNSWTQLSNSTMEVQICYAVWNTNNHSLLVSIPLNRIMNYDPVADAWSTMNYSKTAGGAAAWDDKNKQLFIFSGNYNDQNVWIYSAITSSFWCRIDTRPNMYQSAVFDDHNGQLLIFNGDDSSILTPMKSQAWGYNVTTNYWEIKANTLPGRYKGTAVWDSKNGRAYIYGGTITGLGRMDLFMYDPSLGITTREADCPVGHILHTAVWDPLHEQMLVYGGYDGWSQVWSGVYIYTPANNTWAWKSQGSGGPHTRANHMAVWDDRNNVMIVAGGYYSDGNTQYLKDVWTYNPETNVWKQKNDMPTIASGGKGVWDSLRGRMLLVLGYFTSVYDPSADTWKSIPNSYNFSGFYSAVWDNNNNKVLVYGGIGDIMGSSTIVDYSIPYYSPGEIWANPQLLSQDLVRITSIHYNATIFPGTGLHLEISVSNNTQTWSGWETIPNGGAPKNHGKYLQWRLEMNSSISTLSPMAENITINYIINKVPVVSANGPVNGFRNQAVNLTGVASDRDNDPLQLEWTQLLGPPCKILNNTTSKATFIAAVPGNYEFAFSASDNFSTSSKSITVIIMNQAPSVAAGQDKLAFRKEKITLNSIASDPEGDTISYSWVQTRGPLVLINDNNSANATIIPTTFGEYTFKIIARDIYCSSAEASTNILVVNREPSIAQNPDLTAFVRSVVNISANGQDPDGDELTYSWTKLGGGAISIISNGTKNFSFIPYDIGKYIFQVTAYDGFNGNSSRSINVTVLNRAPVVVYNPNINGIVNDTVRITFTASDPDTDPLSFKWLQSKGIKVVISTGKEANMSFVPKYPGLYTFQLLINDTHGEVTYIINVSVEQSYPPIMIITEPPTKAMVNEQLIYNIQTRGGRPNSSNGPILVNGPDGMSLNGMILTWTPIKSQKGINNVSISVTDGRTTWYQNWSISVSTKPQENSNISSMVLIGLICIFITIAAIVYIIIRRKRNGPQKTQTPKSEDTTTTNQMSQAPSIEPYQTSVSPQSMDQTNYQYSGQEQGGKSP